MSYLRGPLTRNQIKLLMDPVRATLTAPPAVTSTGSGYTASAAQPAPVTVGAGVAKTQGTRPVLPPKVPQYFVPLRGSQPVGQNLFYQPEIIGAGKIHFIDVKTEVNLIKDVLYRASITEGPLSVDWDTAAEIDFKVNDLEQSPREPAQYGDLPAIAMKGDSYGYWNKDFANWLYRNQKLDLWKSPSLKEFSNVGESDRDFRIRLQQQAREQRDEATDKLRQKYAPKIATLQEQMRRAQAAVEREKEQAKQQKIQTALSFGTTLLGGFMGRKAVSAGSLSRALVGKMDPQTEQFEQIAVRPAKTDISIQLLALGWLPYWQSPAGNLTPAW
jgi:hypothetical protein